MKQNNKNITYFDTFWPDLTLLWSWNDLAMTMGYTPVKPSPYNHVYLGCESLDVIEVLSIGPKMTIIV